MARAAGVPDSARAATSWMRTDSCRHAVQAGGIDEGIERCVMRANSAGAALGKFQGDGGGGLSAAEAGAKIEMAEPEDRVAALLADGGGDERRDQEEVVFAGEQAAVAAEFHGHDAAADPEEVEIIIQQEHGSFSGRPAVFCVNAGISWNSFGKHGGGNRPG